MFPRSIITDIKIIQSSSVANEIMRSNYYDLDIETQRDLVLIINRAQAPKYLKASKFMKLKLSAFTSVSFISRDLSKSPNKVFYF